MINFIKILPILLFYNIIPREADLNKNNLELFIDKVLHFPLWVKQAVYLNLAKDFKNDTCQVLSEYALYVPILTFQGQNELNEKKSCFDGNIYNFLEMCAKGFSILEISMSVYFSMEEVSKFFEFCLEQGFIKEPDKSILSFAKFISGKFRLGEYLNDIGLINSEQLENAIQNMNGKMLGQTLVELGYIKKEDINRLLIIKEEAQKRFVSDYNSIPNISASFSEESRRYEKEIENLKRENELLKKKMKQLLQLVKNND